MTVSDVIEAFQTVRELEREPQGLRLAMFTATALELAAGSFGDREPQTRLILCALWQRMTVFDRDEVRVWLADYAVEYPDERATVTQAFHCLSDWTR